MQCPNSVGLCTFTESQQLGNGKDREGLQTTITVCYDKSVWEKSLNNTDTNGNKLLVCYWAMLISCFTWLCHNLLLSQNSCYSMTDMNMQTVNMIKFFRIISHLKRLNLYNYSTYHYIYNKYTFNKISQRSTLLWNLKWWAQSTSFAMSFHVSRRN